MSEDDQKWTLSIGIHHGTTASREEVIQKHDSLEECRQAVKESEKFHQTIGYFIWSAHATGPNGEKVQLHKSTLYS